MRINRLILRDYGLFRGEQIIDLSPRTKYGRERPIVLIGGHNGAGKSNFIKVFNLLNKIVDRHLQIYTAEKGGADSILHFGSKTSDHLHISLSFEKGVNGYEITLAPTEDDRFFFSDESVWYHDKQKYDRPLRKVIATGLLESKLGKSSTDWIESYVRKHLKS